jgi:hypothetical protein
VVGWLCFIIAGVSFATAIAQNNVSIVLKQAVESMRSFHRFFSGCGARPVNGNNRNGLTSGKDRLKSFCLTETTRGEIDDTPIADLFPHTTVFFADIAGFTSGVHVESRRRSSSSSDNLSSFRFDRQTPKKFSKWRPVIRCMFLPFVVFRNRTKALRLNVLIRIRLSANSPSLLNKLRRN